MTHPPTLKIKSERIRTFDILRGIFLIVILINHIELYPSIFDYFTGRGRLMVSAAEGFFFMSGLLVGLVYRRRIAMGMAFIFKKMWRRALVLYIGAIFLTLLFTALAFYLNRPDIKQGFPEVVDWPSIIAQTLILQYEFGWADFLSRFAILMFLAPFGFYLLTKGKWWVLLVISFIVWEFRGESFMLAWQIIFMGGMIVGYYWQALQKKARSLAPNVRKNLIISIFTLALITFAYSYASVYILSILNERVLNLNEPWQSITYRWNDFNEYIWIYSEKWSMEPLRMALFATWFSALFLFVRRYEHKFTQISRGYVEFLGKNSFLTYVNHAFIVFAFHLFIPAGTSLWQNFVITAAALILLIVTTRYYSMLGNVYRNKRAVSNQSSLGDK